MDETLVDQANRGRCIFDEWHDHDGMQPHHNELLGYLTALVFIYGVHGVGQTHLGKLNLLRCILETAFQIGRQSMREEK